MNLWSETTHYYLYNFKTIIISLNSHSGHPVGHHAQKYFLRLFQKYRTTLSRVKSVSHGQQNGTITWKYNKSNKSMIQKLDSKLLNILTFRLQHIKINFALYWRKTPEHEKYFFNWYCLTSAGFKSNGFYYNVFWTSKNVRRFLHVCVYIFFFMHHWKCVNTLGGY